MIKKFALRYVSFLSKIPERHYWPIFVFLSLYFIVPMSEIVVTLGAILYFIFEKKISPEIGKLTKRMPNWLRFGGSALFFLVMLDDTIAYTTIILWAFWSGRAVKRHKALDKDGDPSYTDQDER